MGSGKETCLVCLKNNYDDKTLIFFDLTTLDWENVTYLNKLEFVLNAEIVVDESMSICCNCLNDLNNAFDFKERAAKALEYWSMKFEENVIIDKKEEEMEYSVEDVQVNSDVIKHPEYNVLENCFDHNEISKVENNDYNSDNKSNTSFPCHNCNFTFFTSVDLIAHNCDNSQVVDIKEESPKLNKSTKKSKSNVFYCELCEISFGKRWKLNKHLKGHAIDKKYICTICNHAFKQSYHLREHMTSHTGEHNFMCNVCGKTFQRISSQKRHMRSHDALPGEKSKKSPFLCNICGKRFPYSNGAQRHMRIHTGDRRYECKICTRKFSQSTHLKVHLRTHTGEKPYMCCVCGESFALKAGLDKHMKKHSSAKDDIQILHNLEPNLSQTGFTEDSEDIKSDDYIIDELV